MLSNRVCIVQVHVQRVSLHSDYMYTQMWTVHVCRHFKICPTYSILYTHTQSTRKDRHKHRHTYYSVQC